MDFEINTKMLVREAMSSPVLSVIEDQNIVEVAKLMRDGKVGALIVTNNDNLPVGIVTERDIVNRVVAKGITLSSVIASDVMTSPLKTVEPEMSLMDAMSLMDKMNIRRLGISYKGQLVGIISDRNIIRLVPTIVEIIREHKEINNSQRLGPSSIGYCERCEIYSMNLRQIDGEFLCEDCRIE